MLLACSWSQSGESTADHYARALAAADFDSAWALCAGAGPERADCEQAVVARHGRFDRCGAIAEGVWREECEFAEAEHLSRGGDRPAALRACHASNFSVNCEQHVLDGLAMTLRDATAADVAAAFATVRPDVTGKNSALDFWRSWHRIRLAAGLPVASEDCPDKTCRLALHAQVRREAFARLGGGGCTPTPPTIGATSPEVTRWIDRAWRERCCLEPGRCSPATVELADEPE
ncbi:MAG: hypothetical protein Q8P41_06940 [Pseudomonadota bacterium]|nr:hypothetical protein [Pseudomonadota bacterium]